MTIIGIPQTMRYVANLHKQIQFATANALNDTGKDIQKWTVGSGAQGGHLGAKFTLRAKGSPWQRPGTKMGFNMKFASKDKLEAVLGSQANWLDEQESGGKKDQKIMGHRIAIPTPYWKKREELMAREKKPKTLLKNLHQQLRDANREAGETHRINKKGNSLLKSGRARLADIRRVNTLKKAIQLAGSLSQPPFLIDKRIGNIPAGIFVRTSSKRLPIKTLFLFEPSINIKPRLEWIVNALTHAKSVYQRYFDYHFARALLAK